MHVLPLMQTVASVTPNSGGHGTSITIAGTGFGASRGASTVTISGAQCLFAPGAWSATSITCTVQYPVGGKSAVLVNVAGAGLSSSTSSVYFTGGALRALPGAFPRGMGVFIMGQVEVEVGGGGGGGGGGKECGAVDACAGL
jgi:hypothetical protein